MGRSLVNKNCLEEAWSEEMIKKKINNFYLVWKKSSHIDGRIFHIWNKYYNLYFYYELNLSRQKAIMQAEALDQFY